MRFTAGSSMGVMGARAALLLAVAFPMLAARPAGAGPEPVSAQTLDALKPGVPQIMTAKGTGSGFLVREDGLVVTAFHVISGASAAWVHFPGGEVAEVEGLASYLPELDMAVLKVKADRLPKAPRLIEIARAEAAPDTAVAALGYPDGKAQTVLHGTVLKEDGRSATSPLPVDVPVRPGCSGGPLVNARGQAVGVVVSMLGNEVGFVMPISGLMPLPPRGGAVISLEDANRAQEGTVWELSSQGQALLGFWAAREDEGQARKEGLKYARSRLAEAAKRKPDNIQALVNASVCSAYLGEFSSAASYLRQALQAAPGNIVARYLLSFALGAGGNVKAAKDELRKVVSESPSFILARLALARIHGASKEYRPAAAEFRAILAIRPDHTEALMGFGRVLAMLGQHGEARAQFQRLTEIEPRNAVAHRSLGEACLELKQWPEAEKALKKAILLNPMDGRAYYSLGVMCVRTGARGRAHEIYKRLVNLDPTRARRLKLLLRK